MKRKIDEIMIHSNQLIEDMKWLFKNELFSDIHFSMNNEIQLENSKKTEEIEEKGLIPAHKVSM